MHAQELLADDRGTLVPFCDPQAIAAGVLGYLDDPERMRRTRAGAYLMGRDMLWPAVGGRYIASFHRALLERQTLSPAAVVPLKLASRPYVMAGPRLDHAAGLGD